MEPILEGELPFKHSHDTKGTENLDVEEPQASIPQAHFPVMEPLGTETAQAGSHESV